MASGHGLHVEFFTDAVKMEFRSEQEGRPIYEDRTFVKILIPGDNKTAIEREATAGDRERFHEEFARFKNNIMAAEQSVGTPLAQWAPMSRSQVKEYAHFNIHTVEQLAALSDTGKQTLGMGAQEWAAKAAAFIAKAAGSADVQKIAAENVALKARLEAMEQQFANLSAAQPGAEKRGPGRPPNPKPTASDLVERL